ncbi:MAG: hypothetical protein ABSC94_32530 [Polyangiaceae bacterium]|jgi:hypothetical protein
MIRKFLVVTNKDGEVLGTQIGHGTQHPATGITTSLVAGPDQILHKVEFEMPRINSRADVESFHRRLSEFLRK